jgi:hypothetical protein
MSLFFFYKIGEQEDRIVPGEGVSGRGEVVGKGGKRVNTMQKMYTHLCKYKNDTC